MADAPVFLATYPNAIRPGDQITMPVGTGTVTAVGKEVYRTETDGVLVRSVDVDSDVGRLELETAFPHAVMRPAAKLTAKDRERADAGQPLGSPEPDPA